jgi:hypothetical protein
MIERVEFVVSIDSEIDNLAESSMIASTMMSMTRIMITSNELSKLCKVETDFKKSNK